LQHKPAGKNTKPELSYRTSYPVKKENVGNYHVDAAKHQKWIKKITSGYQPDQKNGIYIVLGPEHGEKSNLHGAAKYHQRQHHYVIQKINRTPKRT
jgi:hypothetical protein